MATAYDLAFLSNFSYTSQAGQSTRVFEISAKGGKKHQPSFVDLNTIRSSTPRRKLWAIVNDVGLYNNMYCATFRNIQTNEMVFAFRGTRTTSISAAATDIAVDAMHLLVRKSPYIEAARSYLNSHITNNAIITGHSLGGYLAITMGYYFRNKTIVSFNAPHVMSGIGNVIDLSKAYLQKNFATNRIICYNSTKDFASILTSLFGARAMNMANVKYVNLPDAGFHGLEPLMRQLENRKEHIN